MWIITGWLHISPQGTVKGFNKCHKSNEMDETDDIRWNGSEEGGDVKSECEEDEGTDCEDGDGTLIGKVR
jgi:hypothetical protein